MLQLQRIQKQIDWVIKQIMCIKDGTCSCGMQPTSLTWNDVEQELTAAFANGEIHTVEIPLNGKADVEALNQLVQDLSDHVNDFNNPHQVTQDQVGLGNVDNTSDLDKPISTATQIALDGKLEPGDNISELVNDVGYITIGDVPQPPVLSVAGKTGVVVLFKADITDFNEADYATAAQGLLAESALQPGDNISLLNNDVGYITNADLNGELGRYLPLAGGTMDEGADVSFSTDDRNTFQILTSQFRNTLLFKFGIGYDYETEMYVETGSIYTEAPFRNSNAEGPIGNGNGGGNLDLRAANRLIFASSLVEAGMWLGTSSGYFGSEDERETLNIEIPNLNIGTNKTRFRIEDVDLVNPRLDTPEYVEYMLGIGLDGKLTATYMPGTGDIFDFRNGLTLDTSNGRVELGGNLVKTTVIEIVNQVFGIGRNIENNIGGERFGVVFEPTGPRFLYEDYYHQLSENGHRFLGGVSGYVENIDSSNTLNLKSSNHFKKILTENTTLSITDYPEGTNLTFVIEITQGGSGNNTVTFDTSNVNVKYTSLDVDETVGNITEFWCRYDNFSNTIFVNSVKGFNTL